MRAGGAGEARAVAAAALSLAAAAAAAAAVVAAAALAAAAVVAAAALAAAAAASRRRRARRPRKRAAAAAAAAAAIVAAAAIAATFAAAAAAAPTTAAAAAYPAAAADGTADPPADPRGDPRGEPAREAPRWTFLGGVKAGDEFEYRICDSLYGPRGARQGGGGWTCYGAALRIEAVVPVSGGRAGGGSDVHVVRAAADAGAPPAPPDAILLVVDGGNGRLAVRHAAPADRPLAESLQRTVFWRGGLGGGFQLAYGEPAAELIPGVPSTALLVSGSRVSAGGIVEYAATHGPLQPQPPVRGGGGWRAYGQGASEVVVADGIGLPVSARVYGGAPPPLDHYHPGRPLFEYELVAFGRGEEGGGPGERGGGGPHAGAGRAGDGAPIVNPHYTVHGGLRGGGGR